MREFIEDVPMSFYGLDEVLQLLTNRICGERARAVTAGIDAAISRKSRGCCDVCRKGLAGSIRRLREDKSCDCFGRV